MKVSSVVVSVAPNQSPSAVEVHSGCKKKIKQKIYFKRNFVYEYLALDAFPTTTSIRGHSNNM
jgi:hypothetical protein